MKIKKILNYSYKQSPRCVLLNGCSESSRESLQIFEVHSISVKIHAAENAEVYLEPCQIFKPLTANPTKWSNALKQFVGNSQRIA